MSQVVGAPPARLRGALSSIPAAGHLQRVLVELTKARLVSLVVVSTAVGFVLGSPGPLVWRGLVATLIGTGLTAAGSMALNELVEMARDAQMLRTRHRPLPAGEIGRRAALAIGLTGVALGTITLSVFVNPLTAILGLIVVAIYVLAYTPLKPLSTACTLVGAVCGAIPPMMGWTAAAGRLGFGAWVLASLLFCWQIPHFLALAWLYREDYARGGFRVLPVVDASGLATSAFANLYIVALLPLGTITALAGITRWPAALAAGVLGVGLLGFGIELARSRSDRAARRLFLATLVYLPLVLATLVATRQPASVAAGRLAALGSASATRPVGLERAADAPALPSLGD